MAPASPDASPAPSAPGGGPSSGAALVVGGTGMLAGVVRGLVRAGRRTAVVARSEARIRSVAAGTDDPAKVLAVPADYTRPETLETALGQALTAGERFTAAVLWVHGSHRPVVHGLLADRLAPGALLVDVLGSAVLDPSRGALRRPAYAVPGAAYRAAVLGFADGADGMRWLTHAEISDGVLAALEEGSEAPPARVVGRVEPWADRP
ncbi:hypothetical protein K378_04709 [Streptomyces sp. Amel2xB2]|uniref:short-chain dehydrogenase n=1 Tax=Streptomyces sp. Amel2xB2 TaxID=1305829 RepID=UPI000DBAC915|nr:short-chain dehydrogenase [Streptomyces sp. Amel2xB2]RAJ60012.1 hypothetical protein K378_04709 [Streptomyces sp. Amel2xB2]